MPGKEPRADQSMGVGQKGQQTAQECQLQAAGINFLSTGRAVPENPRTQAVPRDLHPVHPGKLSPCLAPSRSGPDRRATQLPLLIKCPRTDLCLACAQPAHELASFPGT